MFQNCRICFQKCDLVVKILARRIFADDAEFISAKPEQIGVREIFPENAGGIKQYLVAKLSSL